MAPCNSPADRFSDRFSMVLVLSTVVGGATLMAGAAVVLLMMLTHF
jgi:hypothetical protein